MTVSTQTAVVEYIEPGGSNIVFQVPFRFLAASDLIVTRRVAGVITTVTPSVVTGVGDADGGEVTIASSTAGAVLKIARRTARTQPADYTPGDDFPAETHELALDRQMLALQETDAIAADLDTRALKFPAGEVAATLTNKANFAGQYVVGDASGDFVPGTPPVAGSDAALRADLASGLLGTLLVAWKAAGLGAVARTLWARLADLPPTAKDFGAIGNGIADDTDALEALLTVMATAGRADLLSGTYKVTRPLVIPNGQLLGGDVTLDFRDADPADFTDACVLRQGAAKTQIANLAVDLDYGGRIFQFAGAHGLAEGDSFQLSGTVDGAGNGYQTYYRKGEIFTVARVVSATVVEVQNATRDTYPAADVTVWKRSNSGCTFDQGCARLRILAPDTIGYGLRLVTLTGARIDNLEVHGGEVAAIEVVDCYQMVGRNVRTRELSSAFDGYGFSFVNSQGLELSGSFYGYFNGFTAGGGSSAVPGLVGMTRDFYPKGYGGADPSGGLAGFNAHGNCEDYRFEGFASNGVVMAGDRGAWKGHALARDERPAVLFTEMHGHNFDIEGLVETCGIDLPPSLGAINMGSSGDDFGTHARRGGRTKIDVTLRCPNATRPILWRPTALARTDVTLDLALDLVEMHPTTRVMLLSKNSGGDLPVIEFRKLNIMDTAVALTWSLDAGTKIRGLQRSMTVAVAGTGVASATAAALFGPAFPRAPVITASLQSAAFAGASPLAASINTVTASGGTVTIATTDKASQNISSTVAITATLDQQ